MTVKRSRFVEIVMLLGFLAIVAGAATIGSWGTFAGLRTWYPRLRKPPWTPPNWIFGPVWTLLYGLMAVAAWRVWRRGDAPPKQRKEALACWLFQLALNAAWSWLFFALHQTGIAFVELVSLWLLVAATIVSFTKIDRPAALLMTPYLAWLTYAGALNGAIHRMNP